jgi:hypothetical protein
LRKKLESLDRQLKLIKLLPIEPRYDLTGNKELKGYQKKKTNTDDATELQNPSLMRDQRNIIWVEVRRETK